MFDMQAVLELPEGEHRKPEEFAMKLQALCHAEVHCPLSCTVLSMVTRQAPLQASQHMLIRLQARSLTPSLQQVLKCLLSLSKLLTSKVLGIVVLQYECPDSGNQWYS